MSRGFWYKRALLAVSISFVVIGTAQYAKTGVAAVALRHAALWAGLSAGVYLFVLWRKLRRPSAGATVPPLPADGRDG